MATPEEIRERWQQPTHHGLPPPEMALQRNGAITARYAGLYLENRHLFKWAGMATFASARVGLALLPYELQFLEGRLIGVRHRRGEGPQHSHLMQELELLRTTNNKVFADVAWAHRAFADPEGGLEAVERGVEDLPTHRRMSDGFRAIAEGRSLLQQSPDREAEAWMHIWRGNELLLEHEQYEVVQPAFEAMNLPFALFMTLGTMLSFDADNLNLFSTRRTKFSLYMWTQGLPTLVKTHRLPDITDMQQRWQWIRTRALKLWRKLDDDEQKVREMLAMIADRAMQRLPASSSSAGL